jgi:hypothetical protein
MKELNILLMLWVLTYMLSCTNTQGEAELIDSNRIQPSTENPWYWQYKGEPIILLGGSWQDNLFNHPVGLEEHLDLMQSVGGNYIRNVMSHRNVGNVFAYEQGQEGYFDLDRFNDEYWQRFDHFLQLTYERDIIVQIEIWDPWDLHADHQSLGGWSYHPFNPVNTITYTQEESDLPTEIDFDPQTEPTDHPFWRSVPELDNNQLLLQYQKQFVDKLLSYSLEYPHVIYCMNNETGEEVEWGDFWADYVRMKADEAGVKVEITDMRRNEDIRSDDHAHIFNQPDRYTFVDISQNNAWSGLGQGHYDNILYVRERISNHPRPINNNKNYGAARHGEEESIARMGRIIFAGSASARFHRPHPYEDPEAHEAKSEFGMGLSPRAQKIIQSLRMVTDELNIVHMEPRNDLLSDREDNEAYLLAEPGHQYAIYFPDEGSVILDLSGNISDFQHRWINFDQAEWSEWSTVDTIEDLRLTTPSSGHWAVILLNNTMSQEL